MSSVVSVNYFAALSAGEEKPDTFVEPTTKPNKSTKKEDKNPKADPSKARPKKKDPNGNNAAFKDKNAGRAANKKVPVGESATAKHHRRDRGVKDDRHSKSGKVDTQKRVQSGWGSTKNEEADEEAAEADAKREEADEAAEAGEDEAAPVVLTIEEYLAAREENSVNTKGVPRQPNEGADNQQWANATLVKKPEVEAPASRKHKGNKQRKEVVTLDPSEEFLPSLKGESRSPRPNSRPSPRGGSRAPSRGQPRESRGAKGGAKRSGKPATPSAPKFDVNNLPRLG